MIITEKQLLLLLDVLKDSVRNDGIFSIIQSQRRALYEAIMNQQSDLLKEIV